ncbi:hypothetical protein [Kineothrix sedimenti]|uniref:YolD-like protein n=1 Tax=Kineothrix sedimenti TaxID=3123317 RepID=A0ABZ3F0F5_9FIRM
MTGIYDDMIHLPHHISGTHPHMEIIDRAAQFSPFAALTGHDAAIKETARLTDKRIELDEYEKDVMSERLQIIVDNIKEEPRIEVTYFRPDGKKDGGTYVTVTMRVKKVDLYMRILIMMDGNLIPIDDIINIDWHMFETMCDG